MRNKNIGNVLMVSNYPSETAYAWWLMEHFWKTLADQVVNTGNVAYLAYPKITSLSDTIKTAAIKTIELSISCNSGGLSNKFLNFIRNNNISTIYFTDQPYFHLKYIIMRLYGIRHIIIHDHTPGDRAPTRGIEGIFKALRNAIPWVTADYIFCVSELMRQRNIKSGRIPARKCIVVQNGINPFVCNSNDRKKTRKALGLNPDSIVVITTGRAHPYKRYDFVIKCAKALYSRSPKTDIIFLLVGDGPAMAELRGMVRESGIESTVRLLGYRNDVRNLVCASDIALHAALGEGFSLSIIEYMCAGLPVLVPDIPSVSQAIDHNDTGVIYPKNDIDNVITQILKLADNAENRLSMGNSARRRAESIYTLDKCTSDFISAINAI